MPAMNIETQTTKTPVSVGVHPSIIRRLDVAAVRDERSRAEIMRRALREFLDREGIADPKEVADAGATTQRQRRTRR